MIPDTIIQKPTTKGNEAAVSAGLDKRTNPNRISMSPPARIHPQLGNEPLKPNETTVCNNSRNQQANPNIDCYSNQCIHRMAKYEKGE